MNNNNNYETTLPTQQTSTAIPQQYATVTTYPAPVYPLGVIPTQQYTTVTTLNPIPTIPQQYTTVTTYPPPLENLNQQQFSPAYEEVDFTPTIIENNTIIEKETTTTPLVLQEINIQEEKPFLEKAKDTFQQAGEKMEQYMEKGKENLIQAGESLGIVKPAQNIEGPLSEIQDVRKDMGKHRMEQPYEKSLVDRAVETWNEAGEFIGPYTELAKDTLIEAKDTLHEVGEKIGFLYPHQKIEGHLAEIQDIRKSKGKPKMEQPVASNEELTYSEKTKETLMEARVSINQVGEKVGPYAEMAKDTLHEVGEKMGIVYPRQKIEGPLAEIQDVRKSKGKPRMEQPYETKPFSEKAKESIAQTSEKLEIFTEKVKESLQEGGEKVGNIVKPAQTPLVGPPVDLKDVQVDMGWLGPKTEHHQRDQILLAEFEEPNETVVEAVLIEPLTKKDVRDTWNEAGEMIELGKQMGFFNNPQNIGGNVPQNLNVQNQNIELQQQSFVNNPQNIGGPLPQNQNLGYQQQGFVNNPQNTGGYLPQNLDIQNQNLGYQQQGFVNNPQNIGLQEQQQIPNTVLSANEKMEIFAEKARQKMARFTEQAGFGNNPNFQGGAQNLPQGQGFEGVKGIEQAKFPGEARNLPHGQDVGRTKERVVVTETTKVLPA